MRMPVKFATLADSIAEPENISLFGNGAIKHFGYIVSGNRISQSGASQSSKYCVGI